MEKTNSAMAYIRSRTSAPELEGTVVFPDWVMLDRDGRTICHDDDATAHEAVRNKSTAVEVHTTSGHSGYFSFNLADPPKVSYLDLHWKSVFPPAYPSVLAADKNLVLLRIAIPSERNYYSAPADLFVYEACPSPLLLRLPVYTRSARGLADRKKFLVDDHAIGILWRADHYLVADLIVSAAAREGMSSGDDDDCNVPMMTKLCVYYSKTKKWEVSTQTAPPPRDQSNSKFPIIWSTDNVFPFDGRFLCWVDYFSGVLLCDFSNRRSPMLHFVPFPGEKQYSDEVRISKCYPDRFRSVSISQGMICFVHIDNDWHETVSMDDEEVHDSYKGAQSGSEITIWTLSADFNWEKHRVIKLDSLWKQPKYKNLRITHRLPEFPIINVDDLDVLYCLLRDKEFDGRAWMIMVDTKDGQKLQSCTRYVNENVSYITDLHGEACRNSFSNVPLHATVFSKYLKKGGILGDTKSAARYSDTCKFSTQDLEICGSG